jgi:esterase/lipase
MRDFLKGGRFASEGETTRQGAKVVEYDWQDPDKIYSNISTIALSMGGFKPTMINEYWDMQRAVADRAGVYEARRMALYGQMYTAVVDRNKAAQADVINAIKRYNKDVKDSGVPGQAISEQKLMASLKGRLGTVQKQEKGVPLRKSDWDLYNQTMELYPGAAQKVEQRRVR